MFTAQKAVMCRQGRGMRRLEHQMAVGIDIRRLFMGICAPQHENDGRGLRVHLRDNRVGKLLPPFFAMRCGLGHFDREDAIE